MSHAWCRDIDRDEAVRAAEDGRTGPLPTLEEAIATITHKGDHMGTKSDEQAADYRRKASGLRTERVTLEFEIDRGVSPREWPWLYILSRSDAHKMRPSESVRVVEEFGTALPKVVEDMAAEITRLDSERDAAIRERDEFRRALTAENDHALRIKAELNELKDIVVASGSVADRAATAEMALEDAPAASEWRILEVGETLEAGDEMTVDLIMDWCHVGAWVGKQVTSGLLTFRRRVTAPDANGAAGTEPDAWGVRRNGLVDAVAHRSFRSSAEHSAWLSGGTLVPLYAAPQAASGNSISSPQPISAAGKPDIEETQAASGAAGDEPVAWGVTFCTNHLCFGVYLQQFEADAVCERINAGTTEYEPCTVVPLHAAPQAAKGWLTAEERGSIWYAIEGLREAASRRNDGHARTLECILDRSSPPEVARPGTQVRYHSMSVEDQRDAQWIAAIAAAGVTLKEVGK